jgi:hypothetical protein
MLVFFTFILYRVRNHLKSKSDSPKCVGIIIIKGGIIKHSGMTDGGAQPTSSPHSSPLAREFVRFQVVYVNNSTSFTLPLIVCTDRFIISLLRPPQLGHIHTYIPLTLYPRRGSRGISDNPQTSTFYQI